MKNNKPTEPAELTSVQIPVALSNFLSIQSFSGPKRVHKRDLIRDLIIDGLKVRNIEVPSEIMDTI